MQTRKDSPIALAGTQVPLLYIEQLQPGQLLIGQAASHIWEVLEVVGGQITMAKFPRQPCTFCEHTFVPKGSGQECACGVRKQPIKGKEGFLPIKPGRARIHLLELPPDVRTPQEYEFYAYLEGAIAKFVTIVSTGGSGTMPQPGSATKWSESIPIIPILHKVWTLPLPLQSLLMNSQVMVE